MEITLQIILSLVALICFTVGTNQLLKGAAGFLPETIPPQPALDNPFRFLSAMFLSFSFLLIWVVIHIHEVHDLIYFIGIVVSFAGLGRLYSRIKIGSAGTYLYYVMWFEIVLGIGIMVLQYFR
ncbi:DUF4345 domain-containing protein [Cytophaga aurantiaca]|uniref:DUF4345 domain-containing protein n=1 Tax=Cytophaga aurantiaca TaxID=29530 RepID=UPI00035D583D|nr:DUF4345 domain-containing protein [Cytophaga aurantiaca]